MEATVRKPALTRADLDARQCEDPGCDRTDHVAQERVYFSSRCHPGTGVVEVSYRSGVLTLRCSVCRTIAVEIAVAGAVS